MAADGRRLCEPATTAPRIHKVIHRGYPQARGPIVEREALARTANHMRPAPHRR